MFPSLLREFLDLMFQTRKERKIDVKQTVSSLMMDFNIFSHFSYLRNSASGWDQGMRSLEWIRGWDLSQFTRQYSNFISQCWNLQVCFSSKPSNWKRMKSLRTSVPQAIKKLKFGHHWTIKDGFFKSHKYIKNILVLLNQVGIPRGYRN